MFRLRITVTLAALLLSLSATAAEERSKSGTPDAARPVEVPSCVARHRMGLSGRRREYKATAGTIVVTDERVMYSHSRSRRRLRDEVVDSVECATAQGRN